MAPCIPCRIAAWKQQDGIEIVHSLDSASFYAPSPGGPVPDSRHSAFGKGWTIPIFFFLPTLTWLSLNSFDDGLDGTEAD